MNRRFPASVFERGSEPDPRFSLANERTFLAWIRTSLALVAAGIALEALELPIHAIARLVAAIAFVVLGLFSAAQAWLGWSRTERALRASQPLPSPLLAPILTSGLLLTVSVIAIGLLL